MTRGQQIYLWGPLLDESNEVIMVPDEDGNEQPMMGWIAFVYEFYGPQDMVLKDGSILRRTMFFGYYARDKGKKIRAIEPESFYLQTFDM